MKLQHDAANSSNNRFSPMSMNKLFVAAAIFVSCQLTWGQNSPQVNLYFEPQQVLEGETSYLRLVVSNADSCQTIEGDSLSLDASGSASIKYEDISEKLTSRVICKNTYGSTEKVAYLRLDGSSEIDDLIAAASASDIQEESGGDAEGMVNGVASTGFWGSSFFDSILAFFKNLFSDEPYSSPAETPSAFAGVTPSPYDLTVDRFGAAVYALPISTPNGVGGVKPNITALYNSQSPNGLLGKGGSLGGLSVIKRCPQTLVRDGVNKAITWTGDDRFCIDTQRLMLVAGTQGEAESQYKTEIDNGVIYTAKGGTSGNPDYFEARAQDGAVLVFGGATTAKEQGAATMTWALSEYKDAANNAIEYVYEGTAVDGLRIKRINYAFPEPNALVNPGAYIEFIYKDREDPIAKFVAGYEFRNNKLLTQINSYSLPGMLHRSYQMDYATSSGLAGYVSRLQGVDECATQTQCFSVSQFTWGTTQTNASGVTELKDISIGWLGTVMKHGYTTTNSIGNTELADVNGDGISDLIWIEPGTYNGTSVNFTFATYNPAILPFDSVNINSYRVSIDPRADINYVLPFQFSDANADGTNELIYSGTLDTSSDRVRPSSYLANRNVSYWSLNGTSLSIASGMRYSLFADLLGDGFDAQINLNRSASKVSIYPVKKITNRSNDVFDYYWFSSEVSSSFEDVKTKPSNTYIQIANERYRSGDVDLAVADFDGDGQMDVATYMSWAIPSTDKTTFKLNWYSLRENTFMLRGNLYQEESNNIFQDSDGYYDGSLVKRLEVPDINGDGLADVALKMPNQWQYALNKGNGLGSYVSVPDLTSNNPSWFFDVNRDGQVDLVRVTYNSTLKIYSYLVSYWNPAQSKFSDAELLRTTPNQVMTIGDANGDGWVDFVEYDATAKTNNQAYIKIYGYTNSDTNVANGYPGVLAQDSIISIKTGLRNVTTIEYQTLLRPNRVDQGICTGTYTGSQGVPCQDYYGKSHYQPLRFDVVLPPNTLDATSVDTKNYYRKTNEPFAELGNLYAGSARVTQHFAPMPIVTRIKTSRINSAAPQPDSDKKYYYSVLRKQAGGRGLLGFEKTIVEDLLAGTRTETAWRQDWPYTGIATTQTTYTQHGKLLAEQTNQLNLSVDENQGNKVFKPRIEQVTTKAYELKAGGAEQGNLIANVTASAQNSSIKSIDNVTANTSSVAAANDIGEPSEYKLDIDRLGASVYRLPISAPNGVGGVKPNITALYNSQSPNGLLGKGGSLGGLSVIKRCPQTLVRDGVNKAITWTGDDRFCIDTQRLMLVAGTQGEAESQYKTEIDNGVIYTAKGGTSGNPDYFEARAQDGAVLVFGGATTAKEQGAATMTWALSEYKDAANNAIEYVYEGTAVDGLRIKRINYAFPEPNILVNPGAYIEFIYKDREDPIAKFVAGYEFRNNKLLTQINSYSLPGMLHRSYQMDYATSSGLAGYVSRLQGVDECAKQAQCFSASQFTWGTTQVNTSGVTELKDISIGWLSDVARSGYFANGGSVVRADFADLNGNGIGDLILEEQGYSSGTYLQMALSTFDPAVLAIDTNNTISWRVEQRTPENAAQVKLSSFADINADGVQDFINSGYLGSSETLSAYTNVQLRSANQWYFNQRGIPNASGNRYNLYADLDGDGLTYQILMGRDLKYHSSIKDVWLSKIKKNTSASSDSATYFTWAANVKTSFSDINATTAIDYVHIPGEYNNPGNVDMAVADFNGDGKSDVVTYTSWYSNQVVQTEYKLNWYSWDGTKLNLQGNVYKQVMANSYYDNGYMYDGSGFKELTTPDINGDGLADISYRLNNSTADYVLSKGNGFSNAVKVNHTIAGRAQKVWYHDINQDGSADQIFVTYDPISGVNYYNYHVSYWSALQAKYLDPVVLRTTTNSPIIMADTNGDSWIDFVEFDQAAKNASKPYIRIYGFTNALSGTTNNHGVLARDVIVGIKTGIRKFESIEYQTLARPATVKTKTCSSPTMLCQDFYGVNHYESNRIKGMLTGDSLTMTDIDEKSYYRKANEPFVGLSNPYAETARVTQVTNTLPIAIHTKTTLKQSTGDVLLSDKKYFYTSLRTQTGGRGLLGFEKTIVEDLLAGTRTETAWRQDWPYTGMVAKLEEKDLQGASLREADNQLTLKVSSEVSGLKVFTPAINGQLIKRYAAPNVAGQTGRLLSTELINVATSSLSSSSAKSSSSVKSVSSASSSSIAPPVALELTAPGEGAVLNYELGNSIPLSAVVKAADGSIWKDTDGLSPKVVFYDYWMDSTVDQTRSYQKLATGVADGVPVNWTPDSQGVYAIRAMAYLNNGTILYSKLAGVWINRPTGSPFARLMATSYGNSYSFDWTFNFAVEASDEDGVESIGIYANDNFIGNATPIGGATAPRFDWKPSALGAYQIYALVKDKTGKTSKTKTMLVNYGIPSVENKIPPVVRDRYPYMTESLSYPAYDYALGADVYLGSQLRNESGQWKESDNSIPVVKFYASDVYVAESAASGYVTTWRPTLAAAYEMTAISKLKNNELIISRPATLLITQSTAPRALLTAPFFSGESYYQGQYVPVSVAANAMTGASISKVVFYANDEEVAVDTNAPYSLSWMPPSPGLYKLKAHVIDSKGAIGVSAQREIRYLTNGASTSLLNIVEPDIAALNAANDQYFDGLSSSYRLRINTRDLPEHPVIEIFAKSHLESSWSYSPWASAEPGNAATFAGPDGVDIQSDTAGIMIFSVSAQALANYDYRARVCDKVSFNCSEFSALTSIVMTGATSSSTSSSSSSRSSYSSSSSVGVVQSSTATSRSSSSVAVVQSSAATSLSSSSVAAVAPSILIGYPQNNTTIENYANAPCFQWSAISGITSYQITLSTSPGLSNGNRWVKSLGKRSTCWANGVGWASIHAGNAIPEHLTEGVTYYWQVTGSVNGKPYASAIQSFVLGATVLPATPQITNAPVQSMGSFSLEWSPVGSVKVDYYNLKEKSNGQINFYNNLSTRSYILTPLNTMVYEYSLQACNAKGCSDFSAPVRVTANPFASLASPGLVAPADNTVINVSGSNPCFQWTAVSGATSYNATINTDGHFPVSRWQKSAATGTSICWGGGSGWGAAGLQKPADLILKEGVTYYWRVVAVKGSNEAYGFSQTRSFRMTSGTAEVPAVPAAISVEPSSSSFSINWRVVTDASYYELQKAVTSEVLGIYGAEWLASETFSSTSTLVSGLLDYNLYRWRVRACNSAKICSEWKVSEPKVYQPVTSFAPVVLTLPANTATLGGNPCFEWTPNPSATTHIVTVSVGDYFPAQRWAKTVTTGNRLCWNDGEGWESAGITKLPVPANLQSGIPYQWRVVAGDGTGRQSRSETRSFVIDSNSPTSSNLPVPALTVIDADQDCFYVINFGAASNVPSSYVYELYEKKSSNQDWQLLVSRSRLRGNIPPFTLYSDADIFNGRHLLGGAYEYRARVCEGDSCGSFSTVLPVNTGLSCKNVAMPAVKFEPLIAAAVVGQDNPLSVSATTTQGTITQVSFYAGGQLIGTDSSSPFSVNWKPTTEGSTHIEAIAETSEGGTASTHYKSVNVIAQPSVSGSGNFDFKVKQNVYEMKFDLSWKPVVGHTRYELWKRSSGRLDELYETDWILKSISQAEYNAGAISIPVNSMPDALYVQWKLVVCDAANICSSQLSRVKTLQHNPAVTITESLSPAHSGVVDFNKAQNNLCFSWSKDPNAVLYTVTVSDTSEFPERRWQQSVTKDDDSLCWGNVNDWTRAGVYRNELPADLKVGSTYYWRVVVNYVDGRQGFSNTNQFTLSSSLPYLNVTTDVVTQNFNLEWNKVNVPLYQLQVRVGNSVAEVESATPQAVPLADPKATTVAEPMATYRDFSMVQWQVRACHSATNCGEWQASKIKTNQYGAIPSGINLTAPTNGSAIDIAIDQSIPCFKWSADANATDYVVTVSDTPEFTERRWAKATTSTTDVCWNNGIGWSSAGIYKDELHQSLYRGFQYYWRVVSRYPNGSLGFSQTYSFDIRDSSEPVIALLSPKPLEGNRVFIDTQVPVMANVFDNYMRNWRNADGRQPIIDYYINNTLLPGGYRISAGIPVQWHTDKEGTYKIKAVAYLDDARTLRTLEAEVNVVTPQVPTIALQANGSANVGVTVELNATVADPDQQVEQVIFYANGEPVGKTSDIPPYKTRWTPTVAGSYALAAKLVDKRGKEIASAVKNTVVHPSLFSIDGLNHASDFGDTTSQSWRVMPLEQSDVLAVSLANSSRISYNKLEKLLLNRPLKIINRSDMYDNGIVPQLIVLDADQIDLNSGIEIVGEPADLLIINKVGSNVIRCKNCGFINVERAVLAVATPATPLSSGMTGVGHLQTRAAGVIDIDNLQASGAVSLEIIADKVIAKGHINTQQYAHESTEVNPQNNMVEPVLDFVSAPDINSVVVGSGGVSLLQGNLNLNYETLALGNTVAGTGVMDLQATIYASAINIFATDAIQLSGNLSTRSSHRAAQIYRGQLRAQEEKIQLKTIAQTAAAPSLRIHGSVLSDAKVHMIGHSGEIKAAGGIHAHSIKAELIGQLVNHGYIRGYVRATAENAGNSDAMIELGAGLIDNRGEIHGVFNNLLVAGGALSTEGEINIFSEGDAYNRFGGSISAKTIKVVSNGKIRNGSLYAFDSTAAGGKESTTAIHIAAHDTLRLSTHNELAFSASEPPLKNTTASIVGRDVTLQAKQAVENINPYTEPYTSAAVEISTMSEEVEKRANDVQIEATQKLQIFSDTYVLNSSAKLGVSQPGSGHLFSIKAPQVRNERYYSNITMETFSDFSKVKAQNNGRDITVTDWAKGVQSRYGFYSPPGYIYSFAKAEIDFGTSGNGMLNNISFVDFYGDLKVFGQGLITTRGISLEKMAHQSGSTIQVSLPECGHYYNSQGNGYSQCVPRSTYSSTPEGKLLKQSPDNTLFAVNGEISAPANVFNARNDQSLSVLRDQLVKTYEETMKQDAIDRHKAGRTPYIDAACDVESSTQTRDNVIYVYQRFYTTSNVVKCYNVMTHAMTPVDQRHLLPNEDVAVFARKNIADLVNENIQPMNTQLNTKINEYRAWREAAQVTGN